jgi:hypothetical protein
MEMVSAESLRSSFHGPCVEADEWRPLADYINALVAAAFERAAAFASGRVDHWDANTGGMREEHFTALDRRDEAEFIEEWLRAEAQKARGEN